MLTIGTLLVLLMVFFYAPSVSSTEITVSNYRASVDYGHRERGDVFSDTLSFLYVSGSDTIALSSVESEVTCDCIVSEALSDGSLLMTFTVEEEEPDGSVEKVIYVFTDHAEMDLFRLVLNIDVLPSTGGRSHQRDRSGFDHSSSAVTHTSPDTDGLRVLYFQSSNCQTCRRVHDHVLPRLEERWGHLITVELISTDVTQGLLRLLNVRDHYGIPENRSPFYFFVGESQITGSADLNERLNSAIERALLNNEQTYLGEVPEQNRDNLQQARNIFRSFSFWAIVGAGLLDGLNPCAFATIVFFISLLSYAGSSKSQILAVGAGFTFSVFVVYLLLGMGAFRALHALAAFTIVSKAIYIVTLGLLVFLLVLSARDTIRYYTSGGQTSDQVLQLSTSNKRRIHKIMRKGLKTGNLLLGSLGIGALVTLFEAACTGQVYLPTIVLMLQDESLRTHAFFYLVLYNFLFVVPLVIVFAFAYSGVASDRFATWSKRNFGVTRILLTLLFLGLAILMILEFFRV